MSTVQSEANRMEELVAICDRRTNRDIFKTGTQGRRVKDKRGNLTKALCPDEQDAGGLQRPPKYGAQPVSMTPCRLRDQV